MKAVRFKVSGEVLREVLHMPETVRFAAASVADFYLDAVELVVVDDDIPEADEPHEVDPTITKVEAVPERYIWNWGIPVPLDAPA